MYNNLIELIASLITLDQDDEVIVKSLFQPISVKKDTILVDICEVSTTAYFINSGFVRYYKIVETGEEQTIHLSSPGEFIAAFCSFVGNTKSEETLHTLTDAELLTISRHDLDKLYGTNIKWQEFGRKLMETLLLEKEKRIIDQLSLTAQERYQKLLNLNPQLIQHIPIQYVASYIGIKPESLSRIRKQIFLTNVK